MNFSGIKVNKLYKAITFKTPLLNTVWYGGPNSHEKFTNSNNKRFLTTCTILYIHIPVTGNVPTVMNGKVLSLKAV